MSGARTNDEARETARSAETTRSAEAAHLAGTTRGTWRRPSGSALGDANQSVVVPLVSRKDLVIEGGALSSLALSGTLSGLFATSPEALRRRLIGPWAEGLRQYLALRLGDAQRGSDAFSELKRLTLALPMSELVREPGARAHVYRLARRIALEHLARRESSPRTTLRYRAPDEHALLVEALREELSAADAEVLELRHARELSSIELACVLGHDPGDAEEAERALADVEARLERAHASAIEIVSRVGRARVEHVDPSLFVTAFALAPASEPSASAEADDQALEPGTLIGGRYRLKHRVGVGSFGDVYDAEDRDVPGHRVALKLLREPALSASARERALRELKLTAAVFHPSVVLFKDHGWFDERLWFVMPWYDGVTLDRRIEESGGLTRAEAHAIFEPLARALAALHASGIRHQDIKPANILLTRLQGHRRSREEDDVLPVLIDLGVAAKEHEALVGGTPLYFAPEVAAHYAGDEDAPDIGTPADVFALALTLRNALEPETEEDLPAGAIAAFVERRAKSPPSPPRRRELRYLRRSFERWLDPDPERRPSAEAFADELAILVEPEARRRRRQKTLSWLAPLSLAALASFGALGWAYARDVERSRDALHDAHRETAEVREDLRVEESRRAALAIDRDELQRRVERENLTREELESHLDTARQGLDQARERLGATLTARDALASERDELRRTVLEGERQVAALTEANREASERADALDQRLTRAREEHARRESDWARELASLTTRAERSAEEVQRAREERDRADAHVRALEARVADTERERDELSARASRLRAELSTLRARLEASTPSAGTSPSDEAALPEHGGAAAEQTIPAAPDA